MRCEYISAILQTAVSLLDGLMIISPQLTIIGTESSGRVSYAIKKVLNDLLKEIICMTEGKQNQSEMSDSETDSSCEVSGADFLMAFLSHGVAHACGELNTTEEFVGAMYADLPLSVYPDADEPGHAQEKKEGRRGVQL
ncbi:hypothetical protein RhiirA4_457664 [Rhizophagus irregularis]|uniref:Uncharacterized protein n=1 Tax=Rhizophagus irregularis TaxID=588596 RepID=A0A2I1GAJ6_9GLOM|nr:hypothetical protein RhiirA4_457664 [Rhizophagus irregularis]